MQLSSATDSDSEETAATSKAIKTLKGMINENLQSLTPRPARKASSAEQRNGQRRRKRRCNTKGSPAHHAEATEAEKLAEQANRVHRQQVRKPQHWSNNQCHKPDRTTTSTVNTKRSTEGEIYRAEPLISIHWETRTPRGLLSVGQ
ncbi:Phage tail fibre repeat [Escherichia coli]|nr:Phage tail fibre repeat [Escherichia coli]